MQVIDMGVDVSARVELDHGFGHGATACRLAGRAGALRCVIEKLNFSVEENN